MKRALCCLLTVLLSAISGAAADDFRPLFIEINETGNNIFAVRTRLPPRISPFNEPSLTFPDDCTFQPGTGFIQCAADPGGSVLTLTYPVRVPPNAAVVQIHYATGEQHTMTLSPGELTVLLPNREDIASVVMQYTWLGMEHIWIGFDHLLFVLCLIWIAGSWQRILITITGFTVAHSITLVAAALDVLRLPVAPIEAVIALSVLFLATELARGRSDSLAWRHPVAVSASFGLLHGLGFAAVLGEIGLPQLELVTGLMAFNLGVEIGQIVFAAVVMAALALLHRVRWFAARGQLVTSYLVGTIAAWWLIERTASFFV